MECVTVHILVSWEERYDLWLSTWQCWQNGIPTILLVHINTLFQHKKWRSYIPSKHWYAPTGFQCHNTTVLEAMFIYWKKIKLNILLPTKGCTTLRWPTTALLQQLALRQSHTISKTTNHPMLVITLPATQMKMCMCFSNSDYEHV
jgi:hypothetical protein